jgi:Leucine-rich repeat (LRR) protein
LTALRTLDVSRNKINDLKNISELKELKSLNCDENSLVLGALVQISRLSKLQVLSLGKNRLEYPAGVATFPTLPPKMKQLKLHGNSFSGKNPNIFSCVIILLTVSIPSTSPPYRSAIPKQICDPTLSLEKLDLSSNNLASIPSEIGNLKALTELILDNNVLVSLPIEMGGLIKLKVLSLRNNHIHVANTNFSSSNPQPIPSSIFEGTLLIDLNLHGNKLTSTQLNQFDGFSVFLERRKVVKTKNLFGGAMDGDLTLCGLK